MWLSGGRFRHWAEDDGEVGNSLTMMRIVGPRNNAFDRPIVKTVSEVTTIHCLFQEKIGDLCEDILHSDHWRRIYADIRHKSWLQFLSYESR